MFFFSSLSLSLIADAAEDAKLAVEYGANGILVSNHGGRQLDGVLATVSVSFKVLQGTENAHFVLILIGGVFAPLHFPLYLIFHLYIYISVVVQ